MTDNNQVTDRKIKPFLLLAIAAISILLGIWVSNFNIKTTATVPKNLEATLLERSKPVTSFSLVDHDNNEFNLQSLKGNWSFLFFGFTNCPDVCPLALQVMRSVWKTPALQKSIATNTKMIFVSVDPDRDKPEHLKSYVQYYNPEFIGVTGKQDQIDELTSQLGILYGFDDPNENGDYNVSHSGQIILIDPQANMRAVFSPPLTPQSISKDFIAIQKFVEDN